MKQWVQETTFGEKELWDTLEMSTEREGRLQQVLSCRAGVKTGRFDLEKQRKRFLDFLLILRSSIYPTLTLPHEEIFRERKEIDS